MRSDDLFSDERLAEAMAGTVKAGIALDRPAVASSRCFRGSRRVVFQPSQSPSAETPTSV